MNYFNQIVKIIPKGVTKVVYSLREGSEGVKTLRVFDVGSPDKEGFKGNLGSPYLEVHDKIDIIFRFVVLDLRRKHDIVAFAYLA